jgi:DNA-binding protein HU-beta
VAELSEDLEISKQEAAKFLDSFEGIVTDSVSAGDPVMLSGFVKFARVDRPARKGRNPATGETIQIKAKSVVKVTPLKKFKDVVMASKKSKK